MSVSWPIKLGSRAVISQHKEMKNLALMTMTAITGTFSTNLSIFKDVVHL